MAVAPDALGTGQSARAALPSDRAGEDEFRAGRVRRRPPLRHEPQRAGEGDAVKEKLALCSRCGKRPTLQFDSWYLPPYSYRCPNGHVGDTDENGVVYSFYHRQDARSSWNRTQRARKDKVK